MPRVRRDTRAEIAEVALELFGRQGYERTSLREIADRLEITKAALYYHFPSKLDVLRSLMQPYVDDVEAWLAQAEGEDGLDRREMVSRFFDLSVRHRELLQALIADAGAMEVLDVVDQLLTWRGRLNVLLVGSDPSPAETAAAVVAVGGLQDCAMLLPDPAADEHREPALQAAFRALGW